MNTGRGRRGLARRLGWPGMLLILLAACGGISGSDRDDPGAAAAPPAGVTGKAAIRATANVYRFAKLSNGAYFYTGNAGERNIILANYPDLREEGVGFQQLAAGSGGVPVYRFANLGNGGYFYTASVWERDWVIQNRPDMRFEGSTFEVVDEQTPGAVPVLRLANLRNGAYLYTISQDEADTAVASGIWRLEGVAFHAPTPPYEFQLLSGRPSGCIDNQDGCGGGGDGSAGAAGDGSGASGADGKLAGAVAEVWRPFNGGLKFLGSAPVGPASGMVTLRPGTYRGPVLLVFRGSANATYFDEALRAQRPFGASDDLKVMIPDLGGVPRNYGATVFTDAAVRYALARWGSASATLEQNLAAVLTAQRIDLAHEVVRLVVNSQLAQFSAAVRFTDITRMPQVLGPDTPPRSLPNTRNGVYAILLAAFSKAALSFGGGTSPGREFTRQFALDLTDGVLDGRVNGQAVSGARVYATQADPPEFGPRLVDVMRAAAREAAELYASPELTQTLVSSGP